MTEGQASRLLAEYEHLNGDLPRQLRRQLGLFVLAPRVGRKALEALYARPLGQTPFRHRSWLWWTAMRTSGLANWWDSFATQRNSGSAPSQPLYEIRDSVPPEVWQLFSTRMGHPEGLRLADWASKPSSLTYWTRGGVWYRNNNFTRIIILGEHISRPYDYNRYARKLGPAGARLLESELHAHIDEESLIYPDALLQATGYVRNRLSQLTGYAKRASPRTASWFFQTHVPDERGWRHYNTHGPRRRATSRGDIEWQWFPDE